MVRIIKSQYHTTQTPEYINTRVTYVEVQYTKKQVWFAFTSDISVFSVSNIFQISQPDRPNLDLQCGILQLLFTMCCSGLNVINPKK